MPNDNKILKIKERYEISPMELVLKSCKTFAENYFLKFIFPKIGTNTILT